MKSEHIELEALKIEGRNAVLEAFRSGKPIDKLFVLDGCMDGPVRTILREAKKHDTVVNYVERERLDQLSETKKHQGVIAMAAAYEYATVEEILAKAEEKGEPPFVILLDGIEDPHNLGAIIRTANLAGAHGVIIPKRRAVGLTAIVAKTSAGALNYTPVAKVTNLKQTMEELKEKRVEKQPLEYPSAGSTFKRPEGYFAGKLIMDAGLRGFQVGGAAVSEKHCGFVINKEKATASDVYRLIQEVQQEVYRQFGVKLETEVKMVGDFR